jgi:hypothetical protein
MSMDALFLTKTGSSCLKFSYAMFSGEARVPGGGGDAADGEVCRHRPPVHRRGQDPRGCRGGYQIDRELVPALWNRNRRNRNFLTSGYGTVTCYKDGTGSGTVIKWNHKSSHRHSIKLCI